MPLPLLHDFFVLEAWQWGFICKIPRPFESSRCVVSIYSGPCIFPSPGNGMFTLITMGKYTMLLDISGGDKHERLAIMDICWGSCTEECSRCNSCRMCWELACFSECHITWVLRRCTFEHTLTRLFACDCLLACYLCVLYMVGMSSTSHSLTWWLACCLAQWERSFSRFMHSLTFWGKGEMLFRFFCFLEQRDTQGTNDRWKANVAGC